MTILVTGGAGYIGSHMVLALTDAGEDVVVLDNLSTGFWWAVAPRAKLVEGDIGDEVLLHRLMAEHRFDAVVHFAGSIVVPDSMTDPLGYYLNNTVKSRLLMACAVKAKVPRFIFSSTAAVYGNPKTLPVFETEAPAPPLSRRSGGIDGRPVLAYSPSSSPEMADSAVSTSFLTRRSG